MSTEPQTPPDSRSTDAPPRTGLLKVAAATGVGTSLEFYDFAIYGTATALVFTDTFFRSDDAWFATFMGLATFGIGFLMAPLGALLFGWIGDRKGRRTALMMTFVGMGLATVLMGLLPPYAVIGVAAPLLLVLLRMVHGLARGGETGGAATLAMEHAPRQHRALWGVFTALGSPLGTILANIAFALVLLLPREAVASWGWRLPFLFGGVVLVLGLWVRRSVHESPVFQDMVRHAGEVRRAPAAEVFRTGWRRVLLAAGANIGLNSMTFVLAIFMLSYATAAAPQGLGLPRGPVVAGSIVALLLHALANVAGAVASDRFGRRPVMITGAVASMAAALVLFPIAEGGTVTAFVLAVSLGFLTTGVLFGPMYVYFGELFPREQRQTGMGIAYHVGAVLGGGISPLVANRILALTGDAANIGFYLAGALLLTLACLALLPETAPRKVDAAATAPVVGT